MKFIKDFKVSNRIKKKVERSQHVYVAFKNILNCNPESKVNLTMQRAHIIQYAHEHTHNETSVINNTKIPSDDFAFTPFFNFSKILVKTPFKRS